MTRSLGMALGGFKDGEADVEVFHGGMPGDMPEFDGPFCDKDGNVQFKVMQYGRTLENVWPRSEKDKSKRMTWAEFGILTRPEE